MNIVINSDKKFAQLVSHCLRKTRSELKTVTNKFTKTTSFIIFEAQVKTEFTLYLKDQLFNQCDIK